MRIRWDGSASTAAMCLRELRQEVLNCFAVQVSRLPGCSVHKAVGGTPMHEGVMVACDGGGGHYQQSQSSCHKIFQKMGDEQGNRGTNAGFASSDLESFTSRSNVGPSGARQGVASTFKISSKHMRNRRRRRCSRGCGRQRTIGVASHAAAMHGDELIGIVSQGRTDGWGEADPQGLTW